MHPRVSVSAISTFDWSLDRDLSFWSEAGITNVGVSVAKLERFGWDYGVAAVEDAGLRVVNLIGLGPFHLAEPARWPAQRDRLEHALTAARRLAAECTVFTTGPAGALGWEEAADALERALRSPEPAPQIYEDVIVGYEKAGNFTAALSWTDKASTTFGGAPRWAPLKIRLLRKAGRTAEANTLMLSCSVNTPDWRRPCQEANQTPAGQARR